MGLVIDRFHIFMICIVSFYLWFKSGSSFTWWFHKNHSDEIIIFLMEDLYLTYSTVYKIRKCICIYNNKNIYSIILFSLSFRIFCKSNLSKLPFLLQLNLLKVCIVFFKKNAIYPKKLYTFPQGYQKFLEDHWLKCECQVL